MEEAKKLRVDSKVDLTAVALIQIVLINFSQKQKNCWPAAVILYVTINELCYTNRLLCVFAHQHVGYHGAVFISAIV